MARNQKNLKMLFAASLVGTLLTAMPEARAFDFPWSAQPAPQPSAAKENVQTIVLAVDGFSYNAFLQAQKQGLFKEFSHVGAHVAPFPSMTDISWATITHSAELFGAAGRIKNVEATYFDEATQSIQGDPRDYYQRLAFPKYYLGAFDAIFNPYVEALVYFPTDEVPKMEIKSVVDDLLAAKPKKALLGYVGSVDSTAHTQLNRLHPLLKTLDAEIKRLIASFKERGQDIEVVLVSDHGNIGRFHEGSPEQELSGIKIEDTIARAGLNFTQQLKEKNDVAMPLLALGTWGPVYFKDRANRQRMVEELRKEQWFDLAMIVNKNNAKETQMTVVSVDGEAKLQFDKTRSLYYYVPTHGNPLQIPTDAVSTAGAMKPITAEQVAKLSLNTPYPDAIYRLIESASERNFDFPDMIVTLKDGYFIQNALGGFAKMYRTHGSLTANSSFGLFASTKRDVPGQIRSKDILPTLGIDPRAQFGETLRLHDESGSAALGEVMENLRRGVETQARDLGQARIFRHLSRFIADTRPYFLVSEMKGFMEAFKTNPLKDPAGQGMSPMNFDISKFDVMSMISPEDIGSLTDAVLTSGSVEKLMVDPRVEKIKDRVGLLKDAKTANVDFAHTDLASGGGVLAPLKNDVLPAKRAVMKLYQIPFLLQNSMVVQEKPFIADTRNILFARTWVGSRDGAVASPSQLAAPVTQDQLSMAQNLLKEAIKEADLENRVYPAPLAKIYNGKVDDLTVVYVPGIYNGIFDKEIFSLGLNALKDDLGIRVLQPPVESTCGSELNGDIIWNYVYQDLKDRLERHHKAPRYLFLSYSKGAVDTLQFFVKAPSFVSQYVAGMVAIAAPLHGSSILNKSDMPFALVSALSENQGPQICQTEKTAAKSIMPSAMDAFWRKNERALTGLTRYFSVTFESTPEDSHVFMKATKLIAQFDEDNDGVVTVSSSKFPAKLRAIDLGTIHADHLAGILSSHFNQKAFMKGLVSTMGELKVNDAKANLAWNNEIILNTANAGKHAWERGVRPEMPATNSWELNRQMLPPLNDPADSYEPQVKLPTSQLRYDPYSVIDVQKLPDTMAKTHVAPESRAQAPEGIRIDFHHQHMVHFRMDHQFNYESRSPLNLDDNAQFGFIPAKFQGEDGWVRMKSVNNSIRMTTLAYRFSPVEFSKMALKLAVTEDVVGADPVKGKTGKDDSPFQVWFTIRDGRANGDRSLVDPSNDKVILFGYYWGSPVAGEVRPAGAIYENWYSNKNVVVATLPEAKQLLLNGPDMLGKPQNYLRNLAQDLRSAFPDRRVEDMEIVAITLQHDSNDTGSSSEAYFKSLDFLP